MAENGNNNHRNGRQAAIDSAVETLTRLASEAHHSRNFKILVVADQSGWRHELTRQFPKRKWEASP